MRNRKNVFLSNWEVALVSSGCHNKLPQNGWLNTTMSYPLTVPEPRSSKSRCCQGCAPAKALEKSLFHAFSWLQIVPRILGVPWLRDTSSNVCLHVHVAFSSHGILLCVYVQVFLLLWTLVIRLGPTLIQSDLFLTWLHIQRSFFHIRSQSQVLRIRTWTYPLRGPPLNPLQRWWNLKTDKSSTCLKWFVCSLI